MRETLRINGTATIHDAPELLAVCAMRDRLPLTVLRVAVEEVFLHCAKSLLRSEMWNPDTWPGVRPVPSMGEMTRIQTGHQGPVEDDAAMTARYVEAIAAEGRG